MAPVNMPKSPESELHISTHKVSKFKYPYSHALYTFMRQLTQFNTLSAFMPYFTTFLPLLRMILFAF